MPRYESPYHPIPDDFVWARPDDIAEHCREFAAELLLKDVKRTPQERRKLASNCAGLLMRIAHVITGSTIDGRSAEIHCRGGGPPSRAFGPLIFESKKSERRIYIARAAQLVFGKKTSAWLNDVRGRKCSRLNQASESDADFFIVIRELDDIVLDREAHEYDITMGRLPADIGCKEGGEEQEPWLEKERRWKESHPDTINNSRRKRRARWWEDEKKN
jgi:hypothetical protein